jgi:hypothetical protein
MDEHSAGASLGVSQRLRTVIPGTRALGWRLAPSEHKLREGSPESIAPAGGLKIERWTYGFRARHQVGTRRFGDAAE